MKECHNNFMRIILLSIFLLLATPAHAAMPEVIIQESLSDITSIKDPTRAQTFYGNLVDFPHTYQIVATKPFHLFVQIKVPDIDSSTNNLFGIIIKEPTGKGRVEEIVRLKGQEASWESSFDWWSMDSYRMGPIFDQDLGPGTYRIEVSTPDNREKYVLAVGTQNELSFDYFEAIRRLMEEKVFFEKSRFRIVESPLVFVPLFGVGGMVILWYRRRISTVRDAILKR